MASPDADRAVKASRRMWVAVVVSAAVVVGAGVALWRATDLNAPTVAVNRTCADEVAPVMVRLRGVLRGGPPAPDGARLISAKEYAGDCESDGPAIEWQYDYAGTPGEFTAQLRASLTSQGWAERAPGNLPGQLANFTRGEADPRYTIVLFAPGAVYDHFTVSLSE